MKSIRRLLLRNRVRVVLLVCALALLVLPAATGYAAPQEQTCGTYHLIQRGQTMYSISRQYGVSIAALMQANPSVGNPNRIYAGNWLYIPCVGPGGPGTGGLCSAYHTVTRGQTLLQISRQYNVSPFAIAQANGIYNLNLIFAGSTLCIP